MNNTDKSLADYTVEHYELLLKQLIEANIFSIPQSENQLYIYAFFAAIISLIIFWIIMYGLISTLIGIIDKLLKYFINLFRK